MTLADEGQIMQILSQVPGAEEAIERAAAVGWEAVVLVLIVLSGLGSFGWLIKLLMQRHLAVEERILAEAKTREERLATRVTNLEDMVQVKLFSVVEKNSEAMGRMMSAADAIVRAADNMTQTLARFESTLAARPCMAAAMQKRDEA